MKALLYSPEKEPVVLNLSPNHLTHIKNCVGEALLFKPFETSLSSRLRLVINDQAILDGLPPNRFVPSSDSYNTYAPIQGNFMIVQVDKDENIIDLEQNYINYMLSHDFTWASEVDASNTLFTFV